MYVWGTSERSGKVIKILSFEFHFCDDRFAGEKIGVSCFMFRVLMENWYLRIKGETGSLFLLSTEKTPSECPESCPFFQKGNNVSLACFQLKLGAPPGVAPPIPIKAIALPGTSLKEKVEICHLYDKIYLSIKKTIYVWGQLLGDEKPVLWYSYLRW